MGMATDPAEELVRGRLFTAAEVCSRPSAIPAAPGVYAWWFDAIPALVPIDGCLRRNGLTLLYVGISPKRPPTNGRPPSRQTVRSRVRYHFRGNAEGSTLRLTLGVLLGLELRRVGGGSRRTFSTAEAALTQWMADHAQVSVLKHPEPWTVEEQLITTLSLPLNLDQSTHPFRPALSGLRSAGKARAAQLPVLPR